MENRLLYKYRSWPDEFTERMLKSNEVFFASAKRFTDPFDCRIPRRYDLLSPDQLSKVISRYDYPDPEAIASVCKMDPNSLKFAQEESVEREVDEFGVLCLSAVNNSVLMWSHYANHHRGICVGFDWRVLDRFRRESVVRDKCIDDVTVIYRSDLPILVPYPDLEPVEWVKGILRYKALDWAYEQEVRLFWYGEEGPLKLPKDAIAEIILGCEMPPNERNLVREIVKSCQGNAKIFQAKKVQGAFKIEFVEVGD
jgi:hypothetical protein